MSPPAESLSGWHPEDVKAAVRKTGVTLTELALKHGLCESYLRNTLMRPMLQGEEIIAEVIGVAAHVIWPDRYDENGKPDYRKWSAAQKAKADERKNAQTGKRAA